MKITERRIGDVVILDCEGKVTLGEGTMALREAVRDQLHKGNQNIILNLANISYIDSSGIGEFVGSQISVCNEGGRIVLLNPIPKIVEIFVIIKLKECFTIYHDEAEAVASFSAEERK